MKIYDLRAEMAREHKTIFDMPLRVTFYARVSTHKDEQINSQENQVQTFTEMITNNPNWELVDGYIDTIRGESAVGRENFLRMIDDANDGAFDLIICKEISRFSRDILDSISYTRELLKNDVGVYFTSDNICTIDNDSELRLGIMASIAQQEVARLSERVKFGHKKAIENGVVMGNNRIYGYDKLNKKLVINEKEAEMVRFIFETFATGDYSLRQMEKILYYKGYRSRSGTEIKHNTIKNIIRNPKYKGYYCGHKIQIVDYRTKEQKFLPPEEWVMYKDETGDIVPQIVDEELWDKCNKLTETFTYQGNVRGIKKTHPLSGMIICGHCGKTFYHNSYGHGNGRTVKHHWICSNKKTQSSSCPTFAIKDDEMMELLGKYFLLISDNIEVYLNKYIELYKTYVSSESNESEIQKLTKTLSQLEIKKSKLLDLYTDDIINKAEFKERNDELSSQILNLQNEIQLLSSKNKSLDETVSNIKALKSYFVKNKNIETESSTLSDDLILELCKNLVKTIVVQPVSKTEMDVVIQLKIDSENTIRFNKSVVTSGNITKKILPKVTQVYNRQRLPSLGGFYNITVNMYTGFIL